MKAMVIGFVGLVIWVALLTLMALPYDQYGDFSIIGAIGTIAILATEFGFILAAIKGAREAGYSKGYDNLKRHICSGIDYIKIPINGTVCLRQALQLIVFNGRTTDNIKLVGAAVPEDENSSITSVAQ